MADSFGPRTFFVGQVLCGMAAHGDIITDTEIAYAIQVADKTMDKMTWPNGEPERLEM